MLTEEQRAELEALGPATVRAKLQQHGAGRGAALAGFSKSALHLTRGDIEDWLAEKYADEAEMQSATLRWAKIAAWAGIVSVIVSALSIVTTVWLAK